MEDYFSPRVEFAFNLPIVLKITDIIESTLDVSQPLLEQETMLPRPKVEIYKKWAYFIGLIEPDFTLNLFGKYRFEFLYECSEKLFYEIAYFFLIQRSSLFRSIILDGYHHYKQKGKEPFAVDDLKIWIKAALPDKGHQDTHFEKSISLYISSLNISDGLPLRILRKEEKSNKYAFTPYFPSLECLFFVINYQAHQRYLREEGSTIIKPSNIYSDFDSITNLYVSTEEHMHYLVDQLISKGYLSHEKSAGLDHLSIHTNFRDMEKIYQQLIEGI